MFVMLQFVQRRTTPMMTRTMTRSLGSCIQKQTSSVADFRTPAETFYCLKLWSRYKNTNEPLKDGCEGLGVLFDFIHTHTQAHYVRVLYERLNNIRQWNTSLQFSDLYTLFLCFFSFFPQRLTAPILHIQGCFQVFTGERYCVCENSSRKAFFFCSRGSCM